MLNAPLIELIPYIHGLMSCLLCLFWGGLLRAQIENLGIKKLIRVQMTCCDWCEYAPDCAYNLHRRCCRVLHPACGVYQKKWKRRADCSNIWLKIANPDTASTYLVPDDTLLNNAPSLMRLRTSVHDDTQRSRDALYGQPFRLYNS